MASWCSRLYAFDQDVAVVRFCHGLVWNFATGRQGPNHDKHCRNIGTHVLTIGSISNLYTSDKGSPHCIQAGVCSHFIVDCCIGMESLLIVV